MFVKPTNRIVVAGNPIIQEATVEDTTGMIAGVLVAKGTNDNEIIVCGEAGNAIGWLSYEHTQASYRPDSIDVAYNTGDKAAYVFGNIIVKAKLAAGASVVKGDRLVVTANGELKKADAATVTVASGTADAVSGTYDVNGAIPAEGIVVAIAEETVDNSAGTTAVDIIVRSLI